MDEQELKNNIGNTISQYKHKCDMLEDEVNLLKSAIHQISLLPDGIYVGVEKQVQNVLSNIQENQDSRHIKKSVEHLINAIINRQVKRKKIKLYLIDFIKNGTDILGKLNLREQDKKSFEYARKTIKSLKDKQELMLQFSQLIQDCVIEVNEEIRFYEKANEQSLEKIRTLQSQLSEVLSRVETLNQELSFNKMNSHQDFLTHLPNKMAYESYVLQAYYRWQRGFGEISLALAVIDEFKAIQEKYGFIVVDKIIKKIAHLLQSSLRVADFVARFDENTFAIILEHTSAHNAWKVLDKLRIVIEDTEFYFKKTKIPMTLSFGLASLQHGDTTETLFGKVERAVDQAQHSGKNRVILVV